MQGRSLQTSILMHQFGNTWLYVTLLCLLVLKQIASAFALFEKKKNWLRFFICWNALQKKEKGKKKKKRGGVGEVKNRKQLYGSDRLCPEDGTFPFNT